MHSKISKWTATRAGYGALILSLATALWPAVGRANGFRNPPEGAAALGRGGRIAHINDASAIAHNPANLVELDSPSMMLALTLGYSASDYDNAVGGSANTNDPWKTLPNLFVAWPLEGGRQAIGVGLTTPFGQSTVWPRRSTFRLTAPQFAGATVLNLNPTHAMKLGENLAIGIGADVFFSSIKFNQYFPWTPFSGDPTDPEGEAEFEGNGLGLGANIGITWRFSPRQRLAATYRSPVQLRYDGQLALNNRPATGDLFPPFQGTTPHSGFETSIHYPAIAAIGYGLEVTPELRVGLDIEWVESSTFDEVQLDVGQNAVLFPATTTREDWHDTVNFGIGGDWRFRPNWVLRAGYNFLDSPVRQESMSPKLPDADRHVFAAGLGYTKDRHTVDVAVAYSVYNKLEVTGNQNPAFNGDYDLTGNLFAVSYSYKF